MSNENRTAAINGTYDRGYAAGFSVGVREMTQAIQNALDNLLLDASHPETSRAAAIFQLQEALKKAGVL